MRRLYYSLVLMMYQWTEYQLFNIGFALMLIIGGCNPVVNCGILNGDIKVVEEFKTEDGALAIDELQYLGGM